MNILVTGSDGQVGHELLKSLAPLGNVIGLTRADGDLSDVLVVEALLDKYDPHVVINPAAYTAVDPAESESELAFTLNARMPESLARWTRAHDRFLVHFSTDYVYPGHGVSPQTEDEPTSPASVYGQSKLAGDEAILREDPSALIFRTSWVYGARGRNFMLTMLRLAAEKSKLTVVSDQFGAPTPAWLIAQVTSIALQSRLAGNTELNGVLHLSCRGETSWCGFAREIIHQARQKGHRLTMKDDQVLPIPTSEYPAPAPRPANSRLAVDRIELLLGITLPDWKRALSITLADLQGRRGT
ncbi:dTDP-4-dehydrorhamnose reductase [Marinobacter sp. NFXS9]|uniref:dTDP-4-dehydrorhamnose reductase n=1 Tax=Marinobacter sp. NFXS9 TaxID=2818433 RepID=UPI0032E0535E